MKQTQDPRDETAATGKFFRSVRRNEDVPTSTTVIEAIAAVSDGDATDLPPLYDSIDPNALNALFDSEKAHSEQPLSVSFAYLGYKVCGIENGSIFDPRQATLAPQIYVRALATAYLNRSEAI